MSGHDAIVVGAGPNGLAAAITLAGAGRSVLVLEGAATPGGGCRSAELTLPGYVHDVCSAVHPLVAGSPFFRSLPMAELGVELVHPEAPLAHPLDDGGAVLLERSVDATSGGLGADGAAYRDLVGPLVRDAEALIDGILAPPLRLPRHPLALARFARHGLRSAVALGGRFSGERARALLAGMAAHSIRPLDAPLTAGFGLVLTVLGHAVGWPVARGGSGRIADAMVELLRTLGGELETGRTVTSLDGLPPARAVLLDVTPRQLLAIAGTRLPPALPPPARALPVRAGRLQGRLGAGGPDPVAVAGVRAGGDGAPGRDHGRDRRGRGGRRRRRAPGAALRPAGPAEPRGPEPGAGRAGTPPGPTATSPPGRPST